MRLPFCRPSWSFVSSLHSFGPTCKTALAVAGLTASLLPGAVAQPVPVINETRIITPDDLQTGDQFGRAVALDGTIAAIASQELVDRDAVELYDIDTGQKILGINIADITGVPNSFGSDLALEDDLLVVGATFGRLMREPFGGGDGVVYVFDAKTGEQYSAIEPSDLVRGDQDRFGYGQHVDLQGNLALIGTREHDIAYLLDLTDPAKPIETAAFAPLDQPGSFGSDVSIDGNLALIGAAGDDLGVSGPAIRSGSAYLFDISDPFNPVELSKIQLDAPNRRDEFGERVVLEGNLAVVATDGLNRVYLYDVSDPANPIEVAQIDSPEIEPVNFGQSLALENGYLAIGGEVSFGIDKIYLYDATNLNNISLISELSAFNADPLESLSLTLGFDGNRLLVCAPTDDPNTNLNNKGRAYVYTIPEPASAALILPLVLTHWMRRRSAERR